MENINERDFKGVWIPKEIWLNENLTLLEKIIYVEIDSLDGPNHCYASNKHFADFCNCSESKVSKCISKLQNLGMIRVCNFNGRQRTLEILRGSLVKSTRHPSKKYEADSYNFRPSNTYNNTNNKTNKCVSKDTHEGTTEFKFGSSRNKSKTNTDVKQKENNAERFRQLYEQHCPSLGKIKKLNATRIKLINTLCNTYTWDEIKTVLDKVEQSNFLKGSTGWKATFDWIIKESNFMKIDEGNYDNNRTRKKSTLDSNVYAGEPKTNISQKDELLYDMRC